jgi:exodeoxyribonuclease-5
MGAKRICPRFTQPRSNRQCIDAIPWEQRKPYDAFDDGYVLTVHTSQGSQGDDVVLFDESFAFQDSRGRWLYTGITRAAKRLSVVV